jgi:MFS family permease
MSPVSAILPTISTDLGIDVAGAGWVMNSYFLLLVGFILITGRIGDTVGHRRVFALGAAIFGGASAICALAPTLDALIVARAVQGVGAAMVFGTSLALVTDAVPASRRGIAIGLLTMSASFASLIGVPISAFAAQALSWHWAFAFPVGLSLLVVPLALRLPSGRTVGRLDKIDWRGGILLFAALTVLLLSLNHFHEGEQSFQEGTFYHLPMHLLAAGLFVAFAWVETRVEQPLLRLSMLANGRFAAGVTGNGIAHMSMLASSFLIPFLLERGRDFRPADTAGLMTAMQIVSVSTSFGLGLVYDRYRTPIFGWITFGTIAAGLITLGLIGASLPYVALVGISAALGFGLGGFTTTNNASVMGSVDPSQRGLASGMVETTRQLGHSIGVSMSSSIMAEALLGVPAIALPAAYAAGFQQAALAMGIVAALGVVATILPRVSFARWSRGATLRVAGSDTLS